MKVRERCDDAVRDVLDRSVLARDVAILVWWVERRGKCVRRWKMDVTSSIVG